MISLAFIQSRKFTHVHARALDHFVRVSGICSIRLDCKAILWLRVHKTVNIKQIILLIELNSGFALIIKFDLVLVAYAYEVRYICTTHHYIMQGI